MDIVERRGELTCDVRSEDDAWELLRRVDAGEFGDRTVIPRFVGWPTLEITFWIGNEHETLTAPMMEGLLDFQSSLYRSFMLVEEGTTSLRGLSEEQRRQYEVYFQVEEGCTKIAPDLTDIAKGFVEKAAANMTGREVTIVIIVAVLMWASVAAWKAWLDSKAKRAQDETNSENIKAILQAQRVATESDVTKWSLMTGALERVSGNQALIEANEEGKQGLLRAASRVDSTDIGGIDVPPQAARRMARNARTEPRNEEVAGTFTVIRNDADYAEGFRVRLRNVDNEEEFFAGLRDTMIAPDDRAIVAEAEWEHKAFWAKIAVRRHRGLITFAEVTEVRRIEDVEE